jgi:hypothetical protein
MKDWLRSLTTSPLPVAILLTAVSVRGLSLATAPAPLPPVIHPARCHACSASTPAAAADRGAYLLRSGAIEMDDFPEPDRSQPVRSAVPAVSADAPLMGSRGAKGARLMADLQALWHRPCPNPNAGVNRSDHGSVFVRWSGHGPWPGCAALRTGTGVYESAELAPEGVWWMAARTEVRIWESRHDPGARCAGPSVSGPDTPASARPSQGLRLCSGAFARRRSRRRRRTIVAASASSRRYVRKCSG